MLVLFPSLPIELQVIEKSLFLSNSVFLNLFHKDVQEFLQFNGIVFYEDRKTWMLSSADLITHKFYSTVKSDVIQVYTY